MTSAGTDLDRKNATISASQTKHKERSISANFVLSIVIVLPVLRIVQSDLAFFDSFAIKHDHLARKDLLWFVYPEPSTSTQYPTASQTPWPEAVS
jgi:hypothetical protein